MTRHMMKLGAAAFALTALLAPAALAQACDAADQSGCRPWSQAGLEQSQDGNVLGVAVVTAPEAASAVVGTSAAYGNVGSGVVDNGNLIYTGVQGLRGRADAFTTIDTGDVHGPVVGTAVAYGNSSTARVTGGEAQYFVTQTADGDVSATSDVSVRNAWTVSVGTVAAANVSAVENRDGTIRNFVRQDANASVTALSDVTACCTGDSAVVTTTALGNSQSSTGSTTTNYAGAVQITGDGTTISARTRYSAPIANGVTIGASTASGNSATMTNEWGYATLGRDGSNVYQQQSARVEAVTTVNLDSWAGVATASAYGVGNSALVSNIGSDTGLWAVQGNYGDVYAGAELAGQSYSGGTGIVTSTAIGNAASAYVCSTCGSGAVTGGVNQFNGADVTAYGRANTPVAGAVASSAVAIGNTATFQSTGH